MAYLLNRELVFPDPRYTWQDPPGLVAVGGDLSPARLQLAYQLGIFPWYSEQDPILWWSPDPRAVLFLDELKVSRSLQKSIRNRGYQVMLDRDFEAVIQGCTGARSNEHGTWITEEMREAYIELHHLGLAHCVSVYEDQQLVGGLYGLSMGRLFFGESMFSAARDASKVALYYLVQYLKEQNFLLIDCQIMNPHTASLGARDIDRDDFLDLLRDNVHEPQGDIWRPRNLSERFDSSHQPKPMRQQEPRQLM